MAQYFNNKQVSAWLAEYVNGGCVDIELRDKILVELMKIATGVINKYTIYRLYGYYNTIDEAQAIIPELESQCYERMEQVLYKFDPAAKTSAFSMFSQVCLNVLLYNGKRDGRDRKHRDKAGTHFMKIATQPGLDKWGRFLQELSEIKPPTDPKLAEIHGDIVNAIKTMPDHQILLGLYKNIHLITGIKPRRIRDWFKWLMQNSHKFSINDVDNPELPMTDFDINEFR